MSIFHLTKLRIKDFDPESHEPQGCLNGWKLYAWCTDNKHKSCQLLTRLLDLESNDLEHVKKGMVKLFKLACTGQPLETLYDAKKCHDVFSYKNPKTGEVCLGYRIRPGGDVRIYFCYGKEKSIIVFFGDSKRKDKLSSGEHKELSDILKNYLEATGNGLINIVERLN